MSLGTNRDQDSGVLISDCFSCPAGFWCSENGTADFSSYVCSPGYYCPIKIVEPILCPPGTHRNLSGGMTIKDCSPCPGGYYCPPRYCTLADEFFDSNFQIINKSVNLSFLDNGSFECIFAISTDSHINGIQLHTTVHLDLHLNYCVLVVINVNLRQQNPHLVLKDTIVLQDR